MRISDWSSDVCSSDLGACCLARFRPRGAARRAGRCGGARQGRGREERLSLSCTQPSGDVAAHHRHAALPESVERDRDLYGRLARDAELRHADLGPPGGEAADAVGYVRQWRLRHLGTASFGEQVGQHRTISWVTGTMKKKNK